MRGTKALGEKSLAAMAHQSPAAQFFSGRAAMVLMQNNWDIRALRTNALLQKDDWVRLDEAVVRVARQRLAIVDRFRQRGLVYPAGDLGTLIVEWQLVSDFGPAHQSMGLETRGERDRATWNLDAIPVPITHKEFELNLRHLLASRQRGAALDTTMGELAAAVVAEKLEDTMLNGSKVTIAGARAYGFRTFPYRVTGTIHHWADPDVTGQQILDDTLAIIKALEAIGFYGPYEMFVGTAFNARLRDDFKPHSDKTIRERLLDIDSLEAITTSAFVPDGEVILFQATSDVADLAVIQDIATVEWQEMGGFISQFVVFAAMAPRLKRDARGKAGIAHFRASA